MVSKAEFFTIDSMTRKYHVYKDVWSSFIEEVLFCCRDEETGEGSFKSSTAASRNLHSFKILVKRHGLTP